MTTRQIVEPPSSMSWSMAGRSSPSSQLAEFALTPNPSMVWKRWLPSIVNDVPATATAVAHGHGARRRSSVLPAASRAMAVNECVPLPMRRRRPRDGVRAPTGPPSPRHCRQPELHTDNADVVGCARGDADALPDTVAPLAGRGQRNRRSLRSRPALLTVTVRAAESRGVAGRIARECRQRMRAVADRQRVPGAAVGRARVLGAEIHCRPTLNCTPTTPTLSDAVAVTLMLPDTVAPFAGAVSETVGACVSPPLLTVTVRAAEVVVLPAASRAMAVNECVPLLAVSRVPGAAV